MARPRIDAAIAALARRRVDIASPHFGLAFSTDLAPVVVVDPQQADRVRPPFPRPARRLAISVPKRQLRRAVDRNMMKRVAREAWRLTDWAQTGTCAPGLHAMLKLRRAEPEWKSMGRGALKKVWRTEIDGLLVQLVRTLLPPPCSVLADR